MPDNGTGTKRRWWVARQINRIPGTCWTDICCWAVGYTGLRDIRSKQVCLKDAYSDGTCYCGKFRCAK